MSEAIPSKLRKKSPAFGRQARLCCFRDIQQVKQHGLSQTGKYCIVAALKTPPDGLRRVAFLISRRFDLLAVHRNRARRIFREIFHQIYEELPPVWILLIPRRRILHAKMQEVLEEVRRIVKHLQVGTDSVQE